MNRETWLEKGVEELSKSVFKPVGLTIPKVAVTLSLMAGKVQTANRKKIGAIGQNLPQSMSSDGICNIFMSPTFFHRGNSSRVLDVLAHELIHAIDNNKSGHGKPFRDMALKIGLTGKMTATIATPELKAKCDKIVKKIGKFPHGKITINHVPQKVRNIKVECECCDFSFRTSRMNIKQMSSHDCLSCGTEDALYVA